MTVWYVKMKQNGKTYWLDNYGGATADKKQAQKMNFNQAHSATKDLNSGDCQAYPYQEENDYGLVWQDFDF